jgi:hypothetical protein
MIALLPWSVAVAQRGVDVVGVIRDSTTKQFVNGAVVEMAGLDTRYSARTDEEGEFRFRDVRPGAYRAVIRRIGYAMIRTEIIVEPNMKRIDVRMSPIPQTLGRVLVHGEGTGIYGQIGTSTELKPIPNALVFVAGSRDSVFTDSTGAYYLNLKKPGTFMVRVRAPGFNDELFVVQVKRNQVADGSRLLDVGTSRQIPAILWKDFDQRLSWSIVNKSALLPGSEVRRAGGDVSTALKHSGTMVANGMRLGPRVCVFVNGQPRPGYPLDGIRPEEITAMEAYGGRSEALSLLMADWPPNALCSETGERSTPYGPTIISAVVIWTR